MMPGNYGRYLLHLVAPWLNHSHPVSFHDSLGISIGVQQYKSQYNRRTQWACSDGPHGAAPQQPEVTCTRSIHTDIYSWWPEAATGPLQWWESPVPKGTPLGLNFPLGVGLPPPAESSHPRQDSCFQHLNAPGTGSLHAPRHYFLREFQISCWRKKRSFDGRLTRLYKCYLEIRGGNTDLKYTK